MAFGANVYCLSASRKTRQTRFIVTDSLCQGLLTKIKIL